MALRHLLDTSVLTRITNPQVSGAIASLVSWQLVGRTSLTDLEIGYSARSADEWDRLAHGLAEIPLVDVESHHVHRALEVQRALAAAGLRGRPVPDLVIAAVAEDHDATLIHYDADFDIIATLTGQSTRWVVPRGSID